MTEQAPQRTDPGDQSAPARKPTREQIEAVIQNGDGRKAVAMQTADVGEVGHFDANAGGIAARTETGDYIFGRDTPEARTALGEAGYTPIDPQNGNMAVPLNNDPGHNQAVRDALGIGPEHVYRAV